jgi:DNA-binding transcriptional LysR family regulator
LAACGAQHVVPVSDPQARRELGVVWRRTALESPPVAAFLDRLLAAVAPEQPIDTSSGRPA